MKVKLNLLTAETPPANSELGESEQPKIIFIQHQVRGWKKKKKKTGAELFTLVFFCFSVQAE